MEVTNNENQTYEWSDVISGSPTLVEYVASHSNELQKKDKRGFTLLHYAAEWGDLAGVKYLIEESKMDVNIKTNFSHRTPLHLALTNNKEDIVEYLFQHGANVTDLDTQGNSSLHFAASKCNVKILEFLTSHGLNVNLENNSKEIPLHIAANNGNLAAIKYLVDKNVSIVNTKDKYLSTTLILVIKIGNLNAVKYLVEHGADVKKKNKDGNTPLHLAADGGYLDIVKYLIENGADFNAQNDSLQTPMHKAAKAGKTDVLKYFCQLGANLNLTNKYGDTVLHYATGSGNLETVKYIIEEKGFNIEAKNNWNETPIFEAVRFGNLNIVKYLIEEKHVDINVRNNSLTGIVNLAILGNNFKLVKYLVEKHVDINAKDSFGNTPLAIAQMFARGDIIEFLESQIQIRNRRSIDSFIVANVKPNFIPALIARDSNIAKIGLSGNDKTIEHLPNSHQTLDNSKFFFSVENFTFLGCIAEALNNSISKRYNFIRGNGIKVAPSNQIAVNKAREKFDQFVEKKIKNLSAAQQKEIREELEVVENEINESLMRGMEFSGVHGLDDVLEMTKKCFCENLLPEKK